MYKALLSNVKYSPFSI